MKTIIKDNWLEPTLVKFLEKNLLYERAHWLGEVSNSDSAVEKAGTGFYSHHFNLEEPLNKFLFKKLCTTLNKNLVLLRMYCNIQWPSMNGYFHSDDGDLTCLYMATQSLDNSGYFEIKKETKIQFVQNRLIAFDAKKSHRGLAPKKGPRITLAFKCKSGETLQ